MRILTIARLTILEASRRKLLLALAVLTVVVVVLTILLAAGFAALSSERRVNANDEVALDAFTYAETGLELFIAKRGSFGFTAAPPAASESTRITLSRGYADVVLTRVRVDSATGRYGYAIRSHGVSTIAALSGTPQAERTVAEYATWKTGSMPATTPANPNGRQSELPRTAIQSRTRRIRARLNPKRVERCGTR